LDLRDVRAAVALKNRSEQCDADDCKLPGCCWLPGCKLAFRSHLLCDAPKDEQSPCNRNHVLGSRHGEIWRVNFGDEETAAVVTAKGPNERTDCPKQRRK